MASLPALAQGSEQEKAALIGALWAEGQRLRARLAAFEATQQEPVKDADNARVPPARTHKTNGPQGPRTGTHREASVGRAGGGRPLPPDPDHVIIAKAKRCPHCGHGVHQAEQQLQAVYDKIESPPVKPVITRVQQDGGQCAHGGQSYVAPGPGGMEPGTPLGASIQSLATSLRDTHAISYERLAGLFGQVFQLSISEGALAKLFQAVKPRLDPRVAEMLLRLRRSRLMGRDETSARVNGRNQWEWVLQNAEVCIHVIRPSRGHGVIQEVLGDHRPVVWVSDLSSAHKHHPAEQWQGCVAQHLRDGQWAFEAGDTGVAPRMKALLLRAFALHKRRDRLAESTLSQYRGDLRRRLARCVALDPDTAHGRRLKKRSPAIQDHLFLFLEDASLPPTTNSSEQAMRMRTVFRKVPNGFRSDWGRDLCAAGRSMVNTGKRQGLSAYQAIQKALAPARSLFEPG